MNNVQVVTLVGMPGAGKSFAVDYLVKKGLPSVYFGGEILEELKKRGLEVNETNEKIVREDVRAAEGKEAFAKRIIKKIEDLAAQGHNKVVADGLYSWTEYKAFKDYFGERAIIIAVTAARKTRHERLANRAQRPLTDKEVTAREYAEIENLEKGGPIANADYTIVNDSTPEKLLEELDKILKELSFIA